MLRILRTGPELIEDVWQTLQLLEQRIRLSNKFAQIVELQLPHFGTLKSTCCGISLEECIEKCTNRLLLEHELQTSECLDS